MSHRGIHTIIDFSNFFIRPKNLHSACDNLLASYKYFANKNNLNVVGQNHKIFNNISTSPNGFTLVLLLDESHISTHTYTDTGLLALDIFTCAGNPEHHINTTQNISDFLVNNYNAIIDKTYTLNRF